jgi:hypothetical protein
MENAILDLADNPEISKDLLKRIADFAIELIEMGLDVLNPIQCNCPGMDPIELKKDFGKHLTFMGGVDTVDLLPNGSADDVRHETTKLIEGMTTDGGGFILAASHTVPPETPMENIFVIYDVAGVSREKIFDRATEIRGKINKSQKSNDK